MRDTQFAFVENGTAPSPLSSGQERAIWMLPGECSHRILFLGSTTSFTQASGRETLGASRRWHREELVWAVSVAR